MGDPKSGLTCPECSSDVVRGAKFCAHCGTFLHGDTSADPFEPLATGTLIGTYRIVELIGEGGMGRVYLAEHVKLGRRVALKMLRTELASNPVTVARFFAEARAVNQISHENIVEITDFLEQPGGDNCIIMELLRGENLAQRLARKGVLSLPRALEITRQIANALATVHAAGIIHRDLKPDNIFLIERSGTADFVKLLDFGVAKLGDPSGRGGVAMHATAAGQIIGTPEYMSPEQAGGQSIDHRTDVYALGVIFYEMVTGRLPFEAKSFGELLIKHMTEAVELPVREPGLPAGVQTARDELIQTLLAKDPNDRPRTMADVEQRVNDVLEAMELPSPPKKRASTSGSHAPMRDAPSPDQRPKSEDRVKPATDRPRPSDSGRARTPATGVRVVEVTRGAVQTPATRRGGDVATTGLEAAPVVPSAGKRPHPALDRQIVQRATPERLAKSSTEADRLAKASTQSAPIERPAADRLAKASSESVPVDKRLGAASDETPVLARSASGDRQVPVLARSASGDREGPKSEDRAAPARSSTGDRSRSTGETPALARSSSVDRSRSTGETPALARSSSSDRSRSTGETLALPRSPSADRPAFDPPPVDHIADPEAAAAELRTMAVRKTSDLVVTIRQSTPAAGIARIPISAPLPTPATSTTTATTIAPQRTRLLLLGGGGVLALGALAISLVLRGGGDGEQRTPAPHPPVGAPVPPQPPQRAEVRIKFVTAPAGATVRIAGTKEAIGVTPFTKSFPRGSLVLAVEIEKAGYTTVTETVALETDDAIAVTLIEAPAAMQPPVTPAPRKPPKPATRPTGSATDPAGSAALDRNGTMDVFGPKR